MAKTVLITGASRGIGKAVATLFAKSGYQVAVNYLNSEIEAKNLCEDLCAQGYFIKPFKADVSDKAEVLGMVEDIHSHFGDIDVLVNNAGVAKQILFNDIDEAEWDRMFDVNIKGMYNCTQAVLPEMIHKKSGRIINISSMWGVCGASCEVHYSASKAAVIGFTKALAKELGPSNINVNCVAPGLIDTQMNNNLSFDTIAELKEEIPLGRIGTPGDIAQAVLFLADERSSFITGEVLNVNGGMVI